jgi:hypothetical protein
MLLKPRMKELWLMHMCEASVVKPSVCRQMLSMLSSKHSLGTVTTYVSRLMLRGLEQSQRVVGIHWGIQRRRFSSGGHVC